MISLDDNIFYHGPPQRPTQPRLRTLAPPLIPTPANLFYPTGLPTAGAINDQTSFPAANINAEIFGTGEARAEHRNFPSLELILATAHKGVGQASSLLDFDTQWQWDLMGLDSSNIGKKIEPDGDDGSPGNDIFLPMESFSLHPDFIPCLDLSESAKDARN